MKVTLVKCKCCKVSEQGLTSRGLFGSSLSDRLCTFAANRPQDNQEIDVRTLFDNLLRVVIYSKVFLLKGVLHRLDGQSQSSTVENWQYLKQTCVTTENGYELDIENFMTNTDR